MPTLDPLLHLSCAVGVVLHQHSSAAHELLSEGTLPRGPTSLGTAVRGAALQLEDTVKLLQKHQLPHVVRSAFQRGSCLERC